MTIEGLGKKFQDARLARGLTLDEAARMTKIRPTRLAEIEADDFSQFPSLAYAKGFLLIYGKFLDVDITPYLEAFETSDAVTVDGYSYLQDNPAPKQVRAPVVRRRSAPTPSSSGDRTSLMPLFVGVGVIVAGFLVMKLFLNLQRLAPRTPEPAKPVTQVAPSVAPSATPASIIAAPTQAQPSATAVARVATPPPSALPVAASVAPTATATPAPVVAAVSTPAPTPAATPAPVVAAKAEPEVRRAEPVRAEDLKKAAAASPEPEATGPNRVAIKPLKKTYIKVVVDDEKVKPAFERWISPSDGVVEFSGQKISVRVLDRTAVQIKKNGKAVEDNDGDVTVE